MAFQYWTIQHPDRVRLLEYGTSHVFRWSLCRRDMNNKLFWHSDHRPWFNIQIGHISNGIWILKTYLFLIQMAFPSQYLKKFVIQDNLEFRRPLLRSPLYCENDVALKVAGFWFENLFLEMEFFRDLRVAVCWNQIGGNLTLYQSVMYAVFYIKCIYYKLYD